jgi:hypothetical protein
MIRILHSLALVAVAALLGACASTPQARFFALSAGDPMPVEPRATLVLAVGPVDLPRYLDRPQIVSRTGENQLAVDEFNRWGGALDEEVGRVLAQHLGRSLQTQQIFTYPSRLATETDYRIALEIRTFDGPRGGTLTLDLAWSVVDDRTGRVVLNEQASYRAETRSETMDDYVAAMNALLSELGDHVVLRLSRLPSPDR